MNALILSVLWIIYYALHSALATKRIKSFFRTSIPFLSEKYRLVYSVFALVNFLLLLRFHVIVPSASIFKATQTIQILGAVVWLGAFTLGFLALKQYPKSFWFSDQSEDSRKLVVSGLNKYIRHPLYTAVLISLLGLILVFPSYKNLGFALITLIYIIIGSYLEEQKLIKSFGQDYLDYRENTSMIIPGLW